MGRLALAAGLAALLAACAEAPVKPAPRALAEELVVVLPGPDGKTGSVVVEQRGDRTVLDQPYSASNIRGDGRPQALRQSADAVRREFGAVLSALPARPRSFLLYFVSGRDELTDDSKARLDEVLAELRKRPVPDVVVIGHTDTVGTAEANDKLSLQRAMRVKDSLTGIGIPAARIETAGRGEREPIVQTADNVAEPRNRRVELNVR